MRNVVYILWLVLLKNKKPKPFQIELYLNCVLFRPELSVVSMMEICKITPGRVDQGQGSYTKISQFVNVRIPLLGFVFSYHLF